MSKNTGTSELINYFDLGVNGDVGIAGNLTIDTIASATTEADRFLVSDNGVVKYRTGGLNGTNGTSGTSGTSGTDGTSGTSGTSGSSGTSGTSGTSGSSGSSGTSATSGTSGTSGSSGTSVAVSGTTNTLPKFTSSTTIGNSAVTDDGTTVTLVGRALSGTSATFSSSVTAGGNIYSSGNLATATGNQGANTICATLFLGNRGYFSGQDVGAAQISAISTGTFWYSSTAMAFYTNPGPDVTGTSPVERMRITAGGNVGIGTQNPSNPENFLRVLNISSNNVALVLSNTNGITKNWSLGAYEDGSYRIVDNNTPRMTISSTGAATFSGSVTATSAISTSQGLNSTKNIVAGEATPLHLTYSSSDGLAPAVRLGSTQGFWDIQPNNNNQRISFEWNDSVNVMNLLSSGNVAIGPFTSDNGARLQVNGNVTASSFIRNGGTSSQFLKADGSVDSTTYASGNFYAIDFLVVAGGGGGGGSENSNGFGGGGAGGGAGGLLASTTSITVGSSYTVVVGAGGSGGESRDSGSGGGGLPGTNGGFSRIFDTICLGGGQGQGEENSTSAASTGGSGGGQGGDSASPAGSGTTGQGNGGGSRAGRSGGGGGGANTAGVIAIDGVSGGAGGNGITWFDGNVYSTGGGGGGGAAVTNNAPGGNSSVNGGIGSRSTGNSSGGQPGGQATAGAANTGAGGGAAGAGYAQNGQNGGSGIVIIRYPGSQRGTGGTVTSSGGYTYHRFTTSGTFTG